MCVRFVLMHLPGKITYKEIDEMIHTVDKNKDGKISYSEFRVSMAFITGCYTKLEDLVVYFVNNKHNTLMQIVF